MRRNRDAVAPEPRCRCAGTATPFRRDSRAGQKRWARACFAWQAQDAAPDIRVWVRFSCINKGKEMRGIGNGKDDEGGGPNDAPSPERLRAQSPAACPKDPLPCGGGPGSSPHSAFCAVQHPIFLRMPRERRSGKFFRGRFPQKEGAGIVPYLPKEAKKSKNTTRKNMKNPS
mgnify:CR=1 FL=1